MRLKKAVNNRRETSDRYFKPIANLAWDFYYKTDEVKIAAAARSDFLHGFLLAVVQQTAYQNSEEKCWDTMIDFATNDAGLTVDLFDSVMRTMVPAMPGRHQVNELFKAVRKHR